MAKIRFLILNILSPAPVESSFTTKEHKGCPPDSHFFVLFVSFVADALGHLCQGRNLGPRQEPSRMISATSSSSWRFLPSGGVSARREQYQQCWQSRQTPRERR